MRLPLADKRVLVSKIIAKKKQQLLDRRETTIQDKRIDELIDRCTKELVTISEETLLMIGRHGDPAGMPKELIREKAAWMLGLDLPHMHEIDEKKIEEEVVYLSILAETPTELKNLLDNY